MLTIRRDQLEAFRVLSRSAFVERMVAKIETEFPEQYAQLGRDGATQFVVNAIKKGEESHLDSRYAVGILIELVLDFGEDFQRSPDRRWAKQMLRHPTLPDDVKMTVMRERMTELTQGRRFIHY